MTSSKNYFKSICKVTKAFSTARDKSKLLHLIVRSAVESMDGKAACIFLEQPGKDIFVPVSQTGLSDSYLHLDPAQAKKDVEDVLKKGYVAISDATSDPRVRNHEVKKAEGIASMLVVPVVFRSTAIGVLCLYAATRREFSEDDVDFLTALAEQGAIAIENARLVDRMRMNTEFFHDLAVNINSTLDIREILKLMAADIAQVLGVKGSAIRLLNEGNQTLEMVASFGLSDAYLQKGPARADRSMLEALKNRPVVVKDVAADKDVAYREEKMREKIVSILNVPINARDNVIGVLRLYSDTPRGFSEEDIILAMAMAHQGGLAIQNATLYLKLQEEKQDLEKEIWRHRLWF
jgi:GAF domain-containing protein